MSAVKDKTRFLREGLFAKYVVSLVGLVVFVLAVNGAIETWISYRGTRVALVEAMGEKADATARRIEQSIFELERADQPGDARQRDGCEPRSHPAAAPRRLCAAVEPGAGGERAVVSQRQPAANCCGCRAPRW